jgi:hypothetical protein
LKYHPKLATDPISRITFYSTNIFTATTAAASALRIKPAGRDLVAKLIMPRGSVHHPSDTVIFKRPET